MKKFLLSVLFSLTCIACASLKPQKYTTINEFDKIFESDGVGKDSLYDGLKIWIAENFKSAKAVVEYENKEQGLIIGNGAMDYPCSKELPDSYRCGAKVLFTMKAEAKDQKFRLSFSNLKLAMPGFTNPLDHSYFPPSESNMIPESKAPEIKLILLAYGERIKTGMENAKLKKDW